MSNRNKTNELMEKYVKNPSLQNHCQMVAKAMEAYARKLELSNDEVEEWWSAGLLHDLDWEMFPDEHPNKAVNEILPEYGYSESIINAIKAHAPSRTNYEPIELIDKYLFACDELSGFLNAVSLIRPTKFVGLEVKSVTKRLKEKSFAANVNREEIYHGADLIQTPIEEHIDFLIKVFSE